MQTCRSCLSEDIPDQATRCRHCGRRLGPSRAPLVVFIVLVVGVILWALIVWAPSAGSRNAARSQARIEINSLKNFHCSPDIAEEFDRVNTSRFQNEVDRSSLDLEEKEMLRAEFANAMELAGCGFSARNQLKRRPKRR